MKIALYAHMGSSNHGCEALVRGTSKVIGQRFELYTFAIKEDVKYQLDQICDLKKSDINKKENYLGWFFWAALAKLIKKVVGVKEYYYLTKSDVDLAVSIGGDNYCYKSFPERLAYANRKLSKKGAKTILWGCSIEPASLEKNTDMIEDLKRYDLITARETITYNALKQAGVSENVRLVPDVAFQLDKIELPLPDGFIENSTIGINVSPLIQRLERGDNITYLNYKTMIKKIIEETDQQIALIPHVVWEGNNDAEPLKKLYEEFKYTGRVVLLGDYNCMELKGFISRCSIFIGARTHATIAAYSNCVPTLVVGYSVKSKGIAKDIFGTYENYVISVQNLKSEDDLANAFQWIYDRRMEIKEHLEKVIPEYNESVLKVREELQKILK